MYRIQAKVFILCCKLEWVIDFVWTGLQILVAALTFFLGKDEEEKQGSDSESEVSLTTDASELYSLSDFIIGFSIEIIKSMTTQIRKKLRCYLHPLLCSAMQGFCSI